MEERALPRPDVDERRLNAGLDGLDRTAIDVADRATGLWMIHKQFNKAIVLQDRHARLARAPRYEDFSFQV